MGLSLRAWLTQLTHRPDRPQDLEMQTQSGPGVSGQSSSESHTPHVHGPGSEHVVQSESVSKKARQCLFLCLEDRKTGKYVVKVPLRRPAKPRKVKPSLSSTTDSSNAQRETSPSRGRTISAAPDPSEDLSDDDMAVYMKLEDACFVYRGSWKKWLP